MGASVKDITSLFKKRPISAGCGLLCLVLLVVIYVRLGTLAEAETRLGEVRTSGERLKTNINYSAKLEDQLTALTTAVEHLQQRAVRSGELAQNLQYFYRLEAESAVTLIDLRQMNPIAPAGAKNAPAPAFVSLPFSVGAQGEFDDVMTFLRKLENGHHFCRIIQASMKPSNQNNQLVLSLSIQLLGAP